MVSAAVHTEQSLQPATVYCCCTADQFSFPEVRLGWYEPWHPHGDARLAEHVTIVNPNSLPWEQPEVHDQLEMVHLDQALIYKGLDQRNLYHVMMETGNYIFGTACKLLGACTYATSQHQIFSIVCVVLQLHAAFVGGTSCLYCFCTSSVAQV